jgi:hypothetical protein
MLVSEDQVSDLRCRFLDAQKAADTAFAQSLTASRNAVIAPHSSVALNAVWTARAVWRDADNLAETAYVEYSDAKQRLTDHA